MAIITGIEKVQTALRKLRDKALNNQGSVVVGFTQNYAIYVHEDMGANHSPGKTAKYLETPARRLESELAEIIIRVYKQTGDMRKALIIAGLRLQRAAQDIVPIDTGALRASSFTAEEHELDAVAAAAFAKGLIVKQSTEDRRAKKRAKTAARRRKRK